MNNYCTIHNRELQNKLEAVANKAIEDAVQAVADDINSFSFANIEATQNMVYTEVSADLSNTGSKTFYYVQVKGVFYDDSENIVDTNWTYAVGSEGLAPGETKHFSMSVLNSCNATGVDFSILDYQ